MDIGIKGKVALVTAASRGLGFACAQSLAAEGVRVAICSRSGDRISRAAELLSKSQEVCVRGYVCDIRKAEHIKRLLKSVCRDFGAVDILVFNSGHPPAGPIANVSDRGWEEGISLCLTPAVSICKSILPKMMDRGWGRIILLASIFAREPDPAYVVSSTLRAALLALMKCLSRESAPRGVTVNAVLPGYFDTPLIRQLAERVGKKNGVSCSKMMAEWARTIPRGCFGKPAELSGLVTWLTSLDAANVSGAAINCDGGISYGT